MPYIQFNGKQIPLTAADIPESLRVKGSAPRKPATASKPDLGAVPAEQKKGFTAMMVFLFALAAIDAGTTAVIMFSVRG